MFNFFRRKKSQPEAQKTVASESGLTQNEIVAAINNLQKELDRLKLAVTGISSTKSTPNATVVTKALEDLQQDSVIIKNAKERVIEGVFDGQNMIGSDGKQYDVPANYASKSKLVEGDILKLTINNLGSFIYKQIKPINRERKTGIIEKDEHSQQYFAVADGKKWRLLTASVTYFKGEPGDTVIFLIPAEGGSRWAAVENIIPA